MGEVGSSTDGDSRLGRTRPKQRIIHVKPDRHSDRGSVSHSAGASSSRSEDDLRRAGFEKRRVWGDEAPAEWETLRLSTQTEPV